MEVQHVPTRLDWPHKYKTIWLHFHMIMVTTIENGESIVTITLRFYKFFNLNIMESGSYSLISVRTFEHIRMIGVHLLGLTHLYTRLNFHMVMVTTIENGESTVTMTPRFYKFFNLNIVECGSYSLISVEMFKHSEMIGVQLLGLTHLYIRRKSDSSS